MAKPAVRIAALEVLLLLGVLAVLGRSVVVQVVQYRAWHERATALRTAHRSVPARRGTIYDRNGVPLAATQELYRLNITKELVKDTTALKQMLVHAGIPRDRVEQAFQKRFPYISEPLSADDIEPLRGLAGVFPEAELRRVYPLQHLASPWLGTLDDHGRATGGIESALDSVLTGVPGAARYLVDGDSHLREVPDSRVQEPVAGHDVYLTLDSELQGIVEGELLAAVNTLPAHGGDAVVLDVHTGEILAIASIRRDPATGQLVPTTSAAVEPNEPGSTAKIFTAAAVLRTGADTSPVPGHGGVYTVPGTTRQIKDVHAENGMLTLGETIKVSSNVAISQFSLRLTPEQQYETLRDFGFGTPSALGPPFEESGTLRHPPYAVPLLSKPSLAQGYEWETTALQLASGYAAIANDGVLMTPSLLREVRASDGHTTTWLHTPAPVRQAVSPAVAAQLRAYLAMVTDSGGSGAKAQLDNYSVIGKTGTAKLAPAYLSGIYRASFAGMFPGDNPQVAIYVMIDRPSGGEYYGGLVAAPIVRSILLQALAVSRSPLDRRRLESSVASITAPPARHPGSDSVYEVNLPLVSHLASDTQEVLVPELTGLPAKEAAASLHKLGLRVQLQGVGRVTSMTPSAGVSVPKGSAVTIQAKVLP